MYRVLFVCTGNTCRSPMAEAILKHKQIPEIEVKSAGVYADTGQDASSHAKKVMKQNSLEHVHSSQLLTDTEIEWATHIFTMTESHKVLIMNAYPRAMDKTFTLKEFVTSDQVNRDVIDPFGGSVERYKQTFHELDGLIDGLIRKLRE